MRILHRLPLLLATFPLACGSGESSGPTDDTFDDPKPLIYSEQPQEVLEPKPASATETAQPVAEVRPAPFVESPAAPAQSSQDGPGAPPVQTGDCSYLDDGCFFCESYEACLDCWVDASTADTACADMFL